MPFTLKLMLTLALTVLVAVGAVAMIVNFSAGQHFQDYVSLEMRPRLLALAPELVSYFERTGQWVGSESLLLMAESGGMGRRMGRGDHMAGGAGAMVADIGGTVMADPTGRYQGRRLSKGVLQRGLPLESQGRIVGYLVTASGPAEQSFDERLNRSIVVAGALASVVAIFLGLLLTRTVIRPLRLVRDAARRLGSGELNLRVPVTSTDEVGDLARQFNEMAAALERDEQLRRKMTADIAHELRTPLAVIRGQVEALQDGIFDLTSENIVPIHDQVLLLGRLVDDLRDLALAEAGQLPMERGVLSLGPLVSRVVAAFQPEAQKQRILLDAQIDQPLVEIRGDAQRLAQVLSNLLSNALHHTPAGGSITVSARNDGRGAELSVSDNGSGIAPEDLPFVFDRFYRADKSRTRAEGGTGLGLAIARQIVEAHSGTIRAESVLGQGASFTVWLPSTPPAASSPVSADPAS